MRATYWAVPVVAVFATPCAHAQEAAALANQARVAQPQAATAPIDVAAIEIPDLAFEETPADRESYGKYFYFVREQTGFDAAYADLRECDGFARGLGPAPSRTEVPYPYAGTLAGALGGAIGDALSDAIFGSAQRREMRRINMRTCMGYKGYRRFGLPRAIWKQFNFEEGNKSPPEAVRQRYLMQQAKIASSPVPAKGELGL